VLDVEPVVSDVHAVADAPTAADAIRGDVEFRHLTFGFGGDPVLNDVSISIPAGTTAAIVGGTGGKVHAPQPAGATARAAARHRLRGRP
jgi:ATP-binding cassette subfamily B protein